VLKIRQLITHGWGDADAVPIHMPETLLQEGK
jgi:hypothetical protein